METGTELVVAAHLYLELAGINRRYLLSAHKIYQWSEFYLQRLSVADKGCRFENKYKFGANIRLVNGEQKNQIK
jgi:hypothetical protein